MPDGPANKAARAIIEHLQRGATDLDFCLITQGGDCRNFEKCTDHAVKVLADVIEQHFTPPPLTSVIQWVRWERGDYDADTLPDSGQLVVVGLAGRDICGPATLEYDSIDKSFYWAFKEKYGDREATVGDIWAPITAKCECCGREHPEASLVTAMDTNEDTFQYYNECAKVEAVKYSEG